MWLSAHRHSYGGRQGPSVGASAINRSHVLLRPFCFSGGSMQLAASSVDRQVVRDYSCVGDQLQHASSDPWPACLLIRALIFLVGTFQSCCRGSPAEDLSAMWSRAGWRRDSATTIHGSTRVPSASADLRVQTRPRVGFQLERVGSPSISCSRLFTRFNRCPGQGTTRPEIHHSLYQFFSCPLPPPSRSELTEDIVTAGLRDRFAEASARR